MRLRDGRNMYKYKLALMALDSDIMRKDKDSGRGWQDRSKYVKMFFLTQARFALLLRVYITYLQLNMRAIRIM